MGEGRVLSTDLFCKPTDTHQHLHKKSCHPWHMKKEIPYGQALRFLRICSEDRQFQERVGELAGCFSFSFILFKFSTYNLWF